MDEIRKLTGSGSGEYVAAVFDAGFGREAVLFKVVVALLEIEPEIVPSAVGGGGEAVVVHAEGEEVDADEGLGGFQGGGAEGVYLFDYRVGHGETADREATAVDHDERAGAEVMKVVGVGETDVEGEVIGGGGMKVASVEGIETLGNLAVALGEFGAGLAGGGGDRIFAEQHESAIAPGLHPEFESSFLFEGAEKYRITEAEAFLMKSRGEERANPRGGRGGAGGTGQGDQDAGHEWWWLGRTRCRAVVMAVESGFPRK